MKRFFEFYALIDAVMGLGAQLSSWFSGLPPNEVIDHETYSQPLHPTVASRS